MRLHKLVYALVATSFGVIAGDFKFGDFLQVSLNSTLDRIVEIAELLAEQKRFLHQQRQRAALQYPVPQINLELDQEAPEEDPMNMAARSVRDVAIPRTINATKSIQKPLAGGGSSRIWCNSCTLKVSSRDCHMKIPSSSTELFGD